MTTAAQIAGTNSIIAPMPPGCLGRFLRVTCDQSRGSGGSRARNAALVGARGWENKPTLSTKLSRYLILAIDAAVEPPTLSHIAFSLLSAFVGLSSLLLTIAPLSTQLLTRP